jgi:hypothetical protein
MYPKLARAVLLLALLGATGCYHYTVEAPRRDPATEWRGRTVWSFLWGALQSSPVPAEGCEPSNAIDQVRSSTNLGFTLVTALSFGLASPLQVEWRCAKQQTGPGQIRAPEPERVPEPGRELPQPREFRP